MSSSKSVNLYTGTALARLELARKALRVNIIDLADPEGRDHPIVHGVIVADGGQHYTYTRGDHGGLAETVEAVVGIRQPMRPDVPDRLQDLTADEFVQWQAAQPPRDPPPHPDAGIELAPNVEDSLADVADETVHRSPMMVDTSPTDDFLARMNSPVLPEGLAKLVDKVVADAEALARQKAGLPKFDGRSKGNNRNKRPRYDHEKALRMVEYGIRRTKVAAYLGVTDQTVGNLARSRGVKIKPGVKGSRQWDRYGAYVAVKGGESLASVSRQHGIDRSAVERMVRYIDGEAR